MTTEHLKPGSVLRTVQRKTPALSYCEYVAPEPDDSVQVQNARLQLMRTVAQVYPEFLQTLAQDVLPVYQQLVETGFPVNSFLWGRSSVDKLLKKELGLNAALRKWAAEFHADTPWLLVGALRTLHHWHVNPEARKRLDWYSLHPASKRANAIGEFEFHCDGWEGELVTWPEYSQRVRAQFEEYLQEYERKSREHFESRGLIPARTKFSPPNLEWFVLYQFAGQSSKAIVDHLAQSGQVAEDSTVLKGVKAAAELVGWDRLPGGQGEFGTGKFTSQAIFLTPAAGAGVE